MTDIYAIEVKMESIIEFLRDRASKDMILYKPTKLRMQKLLDQFNEGISLIATIMQEDGLEDESEFDEKGSKNEDLDNLINNLYDIADRYESLLGESNQSTSKNHQSSKDKEIVLSKTDKRDVLHQYTDVISKLVQNVEDSDIGYLRECAFVIKQWFDARYKSGKNDFKYDVRTIPSWIGGIVITYSHHIMTNTTQDFVLDFYDWIDNVDEDPMYSNYPVPYDIYMNSKNISDDIFSITALVLWDLLYDNGLNELSICKVKLEKTQIQKVFKSSNLSDESIKMMKEKYRNYKSDKKILYDCNLLTEPEGDGSCQE